MLGASSAHNDCTCLSEYEMTKIYNSETSMWMCPNLVKNSQFWTPDVWREGDIECRKLQLSLNGLGSN